MPVTVTGDPDPALDDCGADAGGTKAGQDGGDAGPQRRRPAESEGRDVGLVRGRLRADRGRRAECRRLDQHAGDLRRFHVEHQFGSLVVPNPTINPGADIHVATADYSAHHAPFLYYASTRNPHHLRPVSVAEIGHNGRANHQYDMTDFYDALNAHNLPAVSYLKAPKYQDAHPGNSDPLLEQVFIVQVINALQQSEEWKDTAVFLQ